jgi:hypothetical protein
MPMITRIAMNGVGVPDARFRGFDVNLTHPDGAPAKAALKRLLNGGGKTSGIKLFTAIFEPDTKRIDRGPRKFKDLFGANVGIVAVEMTVDGAREDLFGGLSGGAQPRQIVGYAGRLRKTDAGADLERLYFHFMRTSAVGLDSLPVGADDIRPNRVSGIKASLQELNAANPGMELMVFEQQYEWQAHVERSLHVDLASSIHFMMALNMQEAGATSDILKNFQRDEDFLAFLLDPIIGAGQDEGLVGTVTQTLRSQSTLGEKRQRREFFAGSAAILEKYAQDVAGKQAAMADHGAALADYLRVMGLVLGRKARLEREAGRRAERVAELRERLAVVREEVLRLTRERNWIDLHRSELIEAGCRRDLRHAEEAAEAARDGVTRTRAALAAVEIMDIIAEIGTLDAQLAEHDAPLTEARAKLAGIGGKARALLLAAEPDLSEAAKRARAEIVRLHEVAKTLAGREATARERHAAADQRKRKASDTLDRHQDELDRLVQAGHLKPGADPAESLDSAATAHDRETVAKKEMEERRTTLDLSRLRAENAVGEAERRLGEARDSVAAVEGELAAFADALAGARHLASVTERFGAGADPYGPGMLRDFQTHHDRVTDRARHLEAENARHAQTIAAIDEHGLIPPPDEIDAALKALKKAGFNAHWAPRYLVRNHWSAERIRASIEADPARFSGIFVLGADAASCGPIAQTLTLEHAPRIPVCIVPPAGEPIAVTGKDDRVVIMPSASTYDRDAAARERAVLTGRIARNDETLRGYHAEAERLREDYDALKVFLTLYPTGWKDETRSRLGVARSAVEARENDLEMRVQARDRVVDELADLAERIARQAELLRWTAERHRALADFQARWDDRRLDAEAAQADAVEAMRNAEDDLTAVAQERPRLVDETEAAERHRDRIDGETADLRSRLAAITEYDMSREPALEDRAEPLEAAYRAQEQIVIALDRGSDLTVRRNMKDDERRQKLDTYSRTHSHHPFDQMMRHVAETSRPLPGDLPALEEASARRRDEAVEARMTHQQAKKAVADTRLKISNEILEPDRVDDFSSREACDTGMTERTLRLTDLKREDEDLSGEADRLAAETRECMAELTQCENTLRQAGTVKGLAEADIPAPDAAGEELATTGLVDRELMGRKRISDAAEEVDRCTRLADAQLGKYRRFLDANTRQKACEEIVAKLRDWSVQVMETQAATLHADHRDLVGSYDDKIVEAGKEMQKCADVIRGYFDRVFERVRIVERLSIMPDGLGDWSKRPFLKIRLPEDKPGQPGLADHVGSRIREWLEQAVTLHSQPDAKAIVPLEHAPLLKQIAVFILRDRLRFETIRVRTNWKVEYKPVTDLKLYSGGEKLMATLLLFFLSVRIGMETRLSAGAVGDMRRQADRTPTMFIVLDNPIGEMNALQLVRPALEMAEKSNIQVIGWTGINDMNVLGLFPLVISLRRRVGVSRTYVEVESVRDNDSPGGPQDDGPGRFDVARLGKTAA